MEDIVDGEPCNPGEWLRVEKYERGGHAVPEWDILAVDGLPQQREPVVLGERGRVARGTVRDGDRGHVLGPHRPPQEGVSETPGGVAACVPVVDIGLGAVGEGVSALSQVAEEGGGELKFVAGLLNLVAGERAAVGHGAEAAMDVPGGEELQEPAVLDVTDGRQFLGEPSLEQQ
ncbi:hypothetical protein ABZS86_35225 [Streptomyces sp. NPDC005355]|uniref:hypothetical protein n=1 Tax=Streptomyces sp. NPDC005355 TaxID=3157038 RepID=UPI0033A57C1D